MPATEYEHNILEAIRALDLNFLWKELSFTDSFLNTSKCTFLEAFKPFLNQFINKGEISLSLETIVLKGETTSRIHYFYHKKLKRYFSFLVTEKNNGDPIFQENTLKKNPPKVLAGYQEKRISVGEIISKESIEDVSKSSVKAMNELLNECPDGVLKMDTTYKWILKYSALYFNHPVTIGECEIHAKFFSVYSILLLILEMDRYRKQVTIALNEDRFIDIEPSQEKVIKWLVKHQELARALDEIPIERHVNMNEKGEMYFEDVFSLIIETKAIKNTYWFEMQYANAAFELLDNLLSDSNLNQKGIEAKDTCFLNVESVIKDMYAPSQFLKKYHPHHSN